ncbi:MAG: hypothetical protein K2M89_06570, partial [Clostridiales bacterium]|nr:hypothetical protein [Clostridiales bacterium]
MDNTRVGKKIVTLVVAFALALCVGLCAFWGINASSSNGGTFAGDNATANNSGELNNDGSDFTYEYGQSYTINGINYTLGEGEKEYIDYKTALKLGDGYTVKLKSFTYPDGTDGTAQADGVRNAGTYELIIESNSAQGVLTSDYSENTEQSSAIIRVGQAPIDFSTVDGIPLFVNANSPRFQAHGDIVAVYKHNDGWYPSQKAGEVPVEIRTITNAYYYETGSEVPIKIAGEVLPDNNAKSTTSTLNYSFKVGDQVKTITFSITDRSGTVFTQSNEYAATFKFNLTGDDKNNYYFDYGNATDDDEIKDSNKCLSITDRKNDSFILSKHWFIVKYANLFVGPDDWNGGKDSTNNPYVPFHTQTPYYTAPAAGEGSYGETYTAVDTVVYTPDEFEVYTPYAKFTNKGVDVYEGEKKLYTQYTAGSITFDVIYDDLDGKKHRVAVGEALDATKTEGKNTLSYYFNKTMPAGHYTLKLYGELQGDKIQGEYWLTVLPAPLDSSLITGDGGIQNTIQGDFHDGEYFNSYLLSENKLHKDLKDEIGALNGTLNTALNDDAIISYWKDHPEYFDAAVTVKYNRNTWSSSTYVDYDEINGMLTQADTYTLYYSISAKNYVTTGGPDDANRTEYIFVTKLSEGVSIKAIYDRLTNPDDPYFKNVTFTGEQVQTLVPRSQQYQESFDDEEDYINVRNRASVTLTLVSSGGILTGWENDLPDGNLGDRLELSDDRQRLTVYFDIVPATNSWTVAPQMSPWTYDAYNKDINLIKDGLA